MSEILKPTVHASYICILRDGATDVEALFIKRANTGHFDDTYSFPAGRHEKIRSHGKLRIETPQEAAPREALEEVNVVIDPTNIILLDSLRRPAVEGDHQRVDHWVVARKWRGNPHNMEPEKCSEIGWYALSDLPLPLAPTMQTFFKIPGILETLRLYQKAA